MGCAHTQPVSAEERELDDRIVAAIKALAQNQNRKLKSFNQVILRFPEIKKAFLSVRSVFKDFDENHDGFIDREELVTTMAALGAADCSPKDLDIVFKGSDMDHAGKLSFKNFLLCLCLASVLHLIPSLRLEDSTHGATTESKDAESKESKDDAVELQAKGLMMLSGLRFVVEAWILFDADGSGSIEKNEVFALIAEKSKKGGESEGGILSIDRWKEMDWNDDGCISFKEFLSAMYEWVDAGTIDD